MAEKLDPIAIWEDRRERRPRIFCTGKSPLLVKLPFAEDNREWLRGEKRNKPKWQPRDKFWEVPYSWRGDVIRRAIDRYGAAIVIKRSTSTAEKCAPACWNATNDVTECVCSCGGLYHGTHANPGGFYEINETLAVRWEGGDKLIATVMSRRDEVDV
jgi:hypothetical protein